MTAPPQTTLGPTTLEPTTPDLVGRLAAQALRAEATLTPKPGLVDRRGGGAHHDMTVPLLLASADALEAPIAACAAAAALPLGPELRAEVGAIGRAGERAMLDATGGVNTHRGALWALGLLAAGVAAVGDLPGAARFAAHLARLDDPAAPCRVPSHGEQARRRYGAAGAVGEARAGFPHTMAVALPALRRARAAVPNEYGADEYGADEDCARLDALLSAMATLEDTCLLHRGGPTGLRLVRTGAAAVLAAGGSGTRLGRRRLDALDRLCRERRLSAGGSGDVLAATLFVDSLDRPGPGEEHPSCAR